MNQGQLLVVNVIMLWLVVLFNVLLTIGLIRRGNRKASGRNTRKNGMLEIGSAAPEFVAETVEGSKVSMSTFADQAVAFVFIAPGCAPCKMRLPGIKDSLGDAQRNGVKVVLVSTEDHESTRALAENEGIDSPLLVAPRAENSFMADYKVPGTPSYVLVSRDGTVKETDILDRDFGQVVAGWATTNATSSAGRSGNVATSS